MCELFALSAGHSVEIGGLLTTFFSHSPDHPHGYGLALYPSGEKPRITKEPVRACDSGTLREFLRSGVSARHALAHIRYATIGNVREENCQPYAALSAAGRWCTLIHNGTIFDYPPLDRYYRLQRGDSDSERILLWLLDLLREEELKLGREAGEEERFRLFERAASSCSRGNKLNLIFRYGGVLYVHTNCRETLFVRRGKDASIFATVPLDEGEWEPVPLMRLLAFRDGELIRSGQFHGNEYIQREEDLKFIYMAYAEL